MNDYSKMYHKPKFVEETEVEEFEEITPDPEPEPQPQPNKEDIGTVNAREVYIRKGPDKSFEHVGTVKKGDQVIVLSREGNFLHIETEDGTQAYIMESFVTID